MSAAFPILASAHLKGPHIDFAGLSPLIALLGGAVIGALVGSAVAQPVYQPVYAQPVYQPVYAQPVYAQPAYQPGPPPGYCFDDYRRAYVPCGPQPQAGYYQQQGW